MTASLIWTPVQTVGIVLLVNIQEVVGIRRSDTQSQTHNPKEIMLKEKLLICPIKIIFQISKCTCCAVRHSSCFIIVYCGELTLAGCRLPTKAVLSLLLLSWTGERKYNERLVGQDKDRERPFTSYCHRQNRLNFGKLLPIKIKVG